MSYEVVITDADTNKPICELSMDRQPTVAEANYLATCISKVTHVGLTPESLQEALEAFNKQYPLHAKPI